MSDMRLAWCAGLFDGQGSIGIYSSDGRDRLTVRINSTSPETLELLQRTVSAGNIHSGALRPPRRASWMWAVTAQPDCERVLRALKPFLVAKKLDATVALSFLSGQLSASEARATFTRKRGPRAAPAEARNSRSASVRLN